MNSVYRTLHIIFIYLLNANRWAINTIYQQYHQNVYDPWFTQNIVDSIFGPIFFKSLQYISYKSLTLSLGYYKENLRWINIFAINGM